jgi:hypothetical protein
MNFQSLKCFQSTSLKNGDKIILPASILDILITMEVQYPLTFEIVTNQRLILPEYYNLQ